MAQEPDPVKWQAEPPIAQVAPGSPLAVKLKAEIEFGWHIYSLTQAPGGPIASKISLADDPSFSLAGQVTSDKPQVSFSPDFGMEIEQHEGVVHFTVPVAVADTAGSPGQKLKVNAYYQACSARVCLPPHTDTILVPVTVSRSAQEPPTGFADPRAIDVMAKVERKMRSAQTIEAIRRSSLRQPDGTSSGWRIVKVQVKRPDQYRIQTLEMDELARHAFMTTLRVTDGQTRLTEMLDPDGKPRRVVEHTAEEDAYVWDDDLQTLAGLYVIDDEHPGIGHDWRAHKLHENNFAWIRMLAPEQWNGSQYQVVEWAYEVGYYLPEDQVRYRQRIYVGADDLVRRVVTNTSKGVELEDQFRTLTLNARFSGALFQVPKPDKMEQLQPVYRSNFKVGQILPDFSLRTPTGESISLSNSLAGKKGAFLWLWGLHCGSCHVEYPFLQQMYDELQPQGITVIGLAGHSPVEPLRALQQAHHSTLPVAVVEKAEDPTSVYGRYGSDWKTFYAVDANRRILYIGDYNVKRFRAIVSKLGGNWPKAGATRDGLGGLLSDRRRSGGHSVAIRCCAPLGRQSSSGRAGARHARAAPCSSNRLCELGIEVRADGFGREGIEGGGPAHFFTQAKCRAGPDNAANRYGSL